MAKEPIEMLPIIGRLKDYGVYKVVSNFDGQGDSGDVYETLFYSKEGEEINLELYLSEDKIYKRTVGKVEDFVYDKIEDAVNSYGGDWVNNDGGYGTLELYLTDFKVECNYYQRTVDEYDWSSSIFK